MSTSVPVDAPWEAASAATWDNQSLDSWVKAHQINPTFNSTLVPIATRPIFGAEPGELSLLFTLFYIAASGNEKNPGTFERNFDTRDGAQMSRFVGGSQLIAIRMAKQLGRRVILGTPVRRIEQDKGGVRVISDRDHGSRQGGDRRDPADAGRAHLLRAEAAVRARPARRSACPRARSARSRASTTSRSGATTASPAASINTGGYISFTVDDSPPERQARASSSASSAATRRASSSASRSTDAPQADRRRARRCVRQPRRASEGLLRDQLVERGVDARRVRWRFRAPGCCSPTATPSASPSKPHPLGGHGDLDLLERLHGRRGALGRARRGGGPGRAVRRASWRSTALAAGLALALAAASAGAGHHRDRFDTQGLRHDRPARLPGAGLRRAEPPRLRGHLRQPVAAAPRRRGCSSTRGTARCCARGSIHGPGPERVARRAGGDERRARAPGAARQEPAPGAPPEHADRPAADLRAVSGSARLLHGQSPPTCSPNLSDDPPTPNYAAWGPDGSLYVTDYLRGGHLASAARRRQAAGLAGRRPPRRRGVRDDRHRPGKGPPHAPGRPAERGRGGAGNPATGRIYSVRIGRHHQRRPAAPALGERARRRPGRLRAVALRADLHRADGREPDRGDLAEGRGARALPVDARHRRQRLADPVRQPVERVVPRHAA